MPGLKFTFGIGKYFNFTFDLQLGTFPPHHPEPVTHSELTSSAGNPPATSTTFPIPPTKTEDRATPKEQPIDPLATAANHHQLLTEQPSTQNVNGSGDGSIFSDSPTSSAEEQVIDFIRPLPRTPRSRRAIRIPLIPRRKIRTRLTRSTQTRHPPIQQLPTKFWALPPETLPIKSSSKSLPTPPDSNTPDVPCSLPLSFLTLPPEIKNMIYRELLVSSAPIKKPHKLVCAKRNIMLDSFQPVKDIDSTILRVCRSIYDEALPVLYGQNTFEFAKPRKFQDFSHGYLEKGWFGFRESETGRFTMIRSIILRLGHDRKPYAYIRPPGAPPAVPDRKRIWSYWHQFFFNDNDSRHRYDSMVFLPVRNEFPALDKIELDFTEWQLGEADAIRTEPFVSKLGKTGGLSTVVIRGAKNKMNLEELRKGLVKPGGSFTAIN
ncbi:MAG: hypothetical protein Q9225_005093 [Loekoesia sp. 1 TL-2023]